MQELQVSAARHLLYNRGQDDMVRQGCNPQAGQVLFNPICFSAHCTMLHCQRNKEISIHLKNCLGFFPTITVLNKKQKFEIFVNFCLILSRENFLLKYTWMLPPYRYKSLVWQMLGNDNCIRTCTVHTMPCLGPVSHPCSCSSCSLAVTAVLHCLV